MSARNVPEDAAALGCLGPYRLIRLIGEGAAGQVYLAEQDSPARQVAIKVLRTASGVSRQRFGREVELLAQLEHNNIARLYDAGSQAGPAGEVPYLVMEYVRGEDLLRFAESRPLSLHARLRLLAQVSRAVHFAHTRGVVHRDLKPGNILVNERGEPKILDFGVAHVTGEDATQMTGAGEILGTLAYMSWEQLCGEAHRIDARSDVYALGVIGYQLVCGELPYPGLKADTLVAAIGRVQRETPLRLAARAPVARGDVDTIIMKALSLDPARRYASAAELAADIERFLERRPIEARPPALGYLLGLFVRRHKAASAAALAIVLALLSASAVSLSFAVSEARARQAAESRLAEREAVTGFLTDMLSSADPSQSLGRQLTVLEVLDAASTQLERNATMPDNVRAQLQIALGKTYVGLGDGARGLTLLQPARDSVVDEFGEDSEQAVRATHELIFSLMQSGQEPEALKALQALEALPGAATRPELDLLTQFYHGRLLTQMGEFTAAEAMLRDAAARAHRVLGAGAATTINLDNELARVLMRLTRFEESATLARAVLASIEQVDGADSPRRMETQEILALALREGGHYQETIPLFEGIYRQRLDILGPDHPDTQVSKLNLGAVYALAKRADEGLPLVISAHETLLARLGPAAALTVNAVSLRAYVASEAGDLASAAEAYTALIDGAKASEDGINENYLPDYNNLGNVQRKLGQLGAARATFEELLALAADLLSTDHPHYGLFESNYGEVLRQSGDFAAATEHLRHALAVNRETLGEDHPGTKRTAQRLERAAAGDRAAF